MSSYIRISNRLVGSYVMTQNNMPPISSGEHSDSIATGEHTRFPFCCRPLKPDLMGQCDIGYATGSWSFDEHMTGKYAVPLGNGSYVTQLEGNFWPGAGASATQLMPSPLVTSLSARCVCVCMCVCVCVCVCVRVSVTHSLTVCV